MLDLKESHPIRASKRAWLRSIILAFFSFFIANSFFVPFICTSLTYKVDKNKSVGKAHGSSGTTAAAAAAVG